MATELGKAYVQIVPSARGIQGKITEELHGEATRAGKGTGLKIASAIKGAIAAAGIGEALKLAVQEGAKLEQSVGGIETLFGKASEAAKLVQQNAKEAYKTSQISANDYMEQVTSFSARLLQSTGGDTIKSAKLADMAIKDMTDNANKMGTSIQDIQNAYQGFSKDNYTMLDNLKLGYGGTKQEMERLLSDAEKLTGIHYDINNLGDVYEAIHAIQGKLNMTGTSAEEAKTTISGSFNAMKAAAQNFMGSLVVGEDIKPSLSALVETSSTFLFENLLPAIGNIFLQLPVVFAEGIINGLPALFNGLQTLASSISTFATENLPLLIPKGIEAIQSFVNGMMTNIPAVFNGIMTVISVLLETLVNNLPAFLNGAAQIINAMINGLINNLPLILNTMGQLIGRLVATIINNLPQIISSAFRIIAALAQGLIRAIPTVVSAIPRVIVAIVRGFASHDWGGIGRDIISGIKNSILNGVSAVADAAKRVARAAFDGAKKLLGIHSPSRKFAWIGQMVVSGFTGGIEDNLNSVEKTMNGIAKEASFVLPSPQFEPFKFEKSLFSNDFFNVGEQIGTKLEIKLSDDEFDKKPQVKQTINFNQVVQTPGETARVLRKEAVKFGLAGV